MSGRVYRPGDLYPAVQTDAFPSTFGRTDIKSFLLICCMVMAVVQGPSFIRLENAQKMASDFATAAYTSVSLSLTFLVIGIGISKFITPH